MMVKEKSIEAHEVQIAITLRDEELVLLPEKAIYWKAKKALLIADLHLGKSAHFRKAGIAVPSSVHNDDLNRLARIISENAVDKLYLLGDLFHSKHNSEWETFIGWRNQYPEIEFHLIKGNHDIMDQQLFVDGNIILYIEPLIIPPFIFTHQPLNYSTPDLYQLFGHIHPGVRMNGRGLQSVSLPCFCFSNNGGVLPAFGTFTGHSLIRPNADDAIYVLYGDKVSRVFA
jgi:DNA ligase-associated metallophosphoesterase